MHTYENITKYFNTKYKYTKHKIHIHNIYIYIFIQQTITNIHNEIHKIQYTICAYTTGKCTLAKCKLQIHIGINTANTNKHTQEHLINTDSTNIYTQIPKIHNNYKTKYKKGTNTNTTHTKT